MIEQDLWQMLPSKGDFFKIMGEHWVEFIGQLPSEQRTYFRNKFLNDWSTYLKKV
jgi:hypothetical protein